MEQVRGGLKLTGQMGDVMNESSHIAYSYVRKILQQEALGNVKPTSKRSLRRK